MTSAVPNARRSRVGASPAPRRTERLAPARASGGGSLKLGGMAKAKPPAATPEKKKPISLGAAKAPKTDDDHLWDDF